MFLGKGVILWKIISTFHCPFLCPSLAFFSGPAKLSQTLCFIFPKQTLSIRPSTFGDFTNNVAFRLPVKMVARKLTYFCHSGFQGQVGPGDCLWLLENSVHTQNTLYSWSGVIIKKFFLVWRQIFFPVLKKKGSFLKPLGHSSAMTTKFYFISSSYSPQTFDFECSTHY